MRKYIENVYIYIYIYMYVCVCVLIAIYYLVETISGTTEFLTNDWHHCHLNKKSISDGALFSGNQHEHN